MRRHVKASSAGSTSSQAMGRGSSRGALVTRGASLRADGTGAPAGSRARLTLLAAATLLASLLLSVAVASAAPPTVTIDSTTSASFTTAQVSGKVDPKDNETYYSFEYSADPVGEGWSPFNFEGPLAANSSEATVSTEFSGLKPGTEYQVRLVAENYSEPSGPIVSAEPNPTFTTKATATPSDVATDPAGELSYTTAHLSGAIDPNGGPAPIRWFFEYSKDPVNEGWSSAGGEITGTDAESSDPVAVGLDVEELTPGAEYVFRLNAVDVGSQQFLSAEPNRTFETLAVPAPSVEIDPVVTFDGTTAHFSGAIDPEAPLDNPAAFNVEYHFECTPACPGLKGERTISADSDSHPVDDDASGLDPNTDYEVRLVASNKGGQSTDTASFKTLAVGPTAIALPAASITETSAIIGAEVDPSGSATTYFIEYAGQADFSDAISIPAGEDGDAGSGQQPVQVLDQKLTGLAPDSEYFFRVSAHSDAGDQTSETKSFRTLAPPVAQSCPNEEFRTGLSAALPNCRAYEKVTPLNKNGGDIAPGLVFDGDNVHLRATSSFLEDDPFFGTFAYYFAHRDADAWKVRPGYAASRTAIMDVNEDFSQEILSSLGPPLSAEDTDKAVDFYVRRGGELKLITQGPLGGNSEDENYYAGQSLDGSHILFETVEHLSAPDTPAARAQGKQLYEWTGDQLRVVGVDDGGELISDSGAVLGHGTETNPPSGGRPAGDSNAISADGSRIFFESPDPQLFHGQQQLYARIDGTETTLVSASQCTRVAPACDDSGHGAVFQGAAKDGSRVLFTTAAQLVDQDLNAIDDLYVFNLETDQLTLISDVCVDPTVEAGEHCFGESTTSSVTAISDDGRRIYFVGPPSAGPTAAEGGRLYLYDERTDTTTFVTPRPSGTAFSKHGFAVGSGANGVSLTADGNVLLFESTLPLTGFDNSDPCVEAQPVCFEIYRYTATTGQIDCISCNLIDSPPIGQASIQFGDAPFSLASATGISNGVVTNHSRPRRWLSDDGETIAFESGDAILPEDTNQRLDVYLWEEGRVSLLSSGSAPADARIAGVTADGESIFFTTFDRLVPSDTDNQADLYDARVDGGLAIDHPPAAILPCAGGSCRGPATPSAQAPPPATSSFSGPGNAKAKKPRCAKGKVRRSGRCVTAHRKKSKQRQSKKANSNRRTHR